MTSPSAGLPTTSSRAGATRSGSRRKRLATTTRATPSCHFQASAAAVRTANSAPRITLEATGHRQVRDQGELGEAGQRVAPAEYRLRVGAAQGAPVRTPVQS